MTKKILRYPTEKRERANNIIARYRSGESLRLIGAAHGITFERARQILRQLGVDATMGGQHVRKQRAIRARQDARDNRAQRFWAIPHAEYVAIRESHGRKPFNDYCAHRKNASSRGIAWNISFKEWWSLWRESGKWAQRGRGHGYCMARFGDVGPYAVGNIYICTGSRNTGDYLTRRYEQQNHVNTTQRAC